MRLGKRIKATLAIILLLTSGIVCAQAKLPPFDGIRAAHAIAVEKDGTPKYLTVMIKVHFDQYGIVTRAALEKSTGSQSLDNAIIKWALAAVIYGATQPGDGIVPITLDIR